VYVIQLREHDFAKHPSEFGIFGDYVGGVLGSLIAMGSVVLLYRTYRTQLDITRNQEQQLKTQQFENTFFELLSNQRTILMSSKGVFYNRKSTSKKGEILSDYQCIDRIAEELRLQMLNFEYDTELLREENINLIRIIVNDYYLEIFTKHNPQLSHYFRHLYHILKFIDNSDIPNKKKYVDLLQAQMSNNELYISFYNGISVYGRKRMLPLMDKYSFLENLKDNDFTTKKHRELFYKKTNFKDYLKERGNTIFVGGIHGVGKGYLCSSLVTRFKDIKHLSASEVIKWHGGTNKEVENIEYTQNRLIQNLKKIISPDEKYLLDGHFCLLKTDNTIEDIPLNTFREINPILIIVVVDEVELIKERLDKRDNKIYNIDILKRFQDRELSYAKTISDEFGVECVQVSSNDADTITSIIHRIF
jgi:adenylate kinase